MLGLSGCSVHSQLQKAPYTHYQDDALAIQEAREAWLVLSSPKRSREWPEARKKYNACIRKLASHLKQANRNGGMDEAMLQSLPFVIEKSPYARDSNPWHYEAIFMSDEVDSTYRLRETVTVEGMGIPLAGLAPEGISRPHANMLRDNGNVHTLTAILDFDRMVDGKPTLRTLPRLMNEHIFIGRHKVRQPWQPTSPSRSPFSGNSLTRTARNCWEPSVPKKPSAPWGFISPSPTTRKKFPSSSPTV